MGTERYVPNHKYLYTFFTLLILLTLYAKRSTEFWYQIFSNSAQYMIGFIFLLATIGKFLAPEFLNGSFFEYTVLTDDRFFGFTQSIGGIAKDNLWEGYYDFISLTNTNLANTEVVLPSSNKVEVLASFLTYWTIFIEGSIALTFLVKGNSIIGRFRNWVLLLFIVTTYPIATVPGFAILLSLLAFITVKNDYTDNRWQLVYLVIFLLLPIVRLPFIKLIETLF